MVKKYQHVIWLGLLGVLTLVGLALRAWGIDSISLDVDEAITLSAAQGLLAVGQPVIQASGLYYGRDILGTLTTAASVGVFGSGEWAARLPMVVFGTATIPLTYILARQLKLSQLWAFLAAAGITFSEWGIYYAHSARMYQEQQFFVLLTAMAAVWTVKHWSWLRVLGTSVLGLLAVLAHRSAVILLPILLGLFVWNRRKELRTWWSTRGHRLRVWAGLATVVVLLLVAQWQWEVVSGVWQYLVGTDRNPFANMQLRLVPFRHLLKKYPVWLVGMVLAWVWVKGRSGLQVIIGLTWGVLISVDLLIYPNEPNYRVRYFYDILPLFFILGAYSFQQFWSWFDLKRTRVWAKAVLLILLIAILMVPGSTLQPQTVYADQPEWNRVAGLRADVVIAHPTAPAHYYLGHVDYWLVSHKGEIRTYSENNQDIYAGAAILLDPQELKSILTTQHGVVVLETNRLKFISKDLRQTLKEFAKKDQELSTELLQVWKF
ncbi:MAG: hypothetical protein AAB558_00520 [Patescibacteria group bacterium]